VPGLWRGHPGDASIETLGLQRLNIGEGVFA
jgi:hypothetical protein